jgi:hypothetical protein
VTSAEDRAERLRVLIDFHRTRGKNRDEPIEELSTDDLLILEQVDAQDLNLFRECLGLEAELRQRGYASAARLLTLVEPGAGTVDDRILALPDHSREAAVVAAYDLGWVYD